MQISKFFLLVCAVSCAALLPLRAAEPAAQPPPAPAAQPPADSESITKAREALRQKMKELEAQPTAATNAPASAGTNTAPAKAKSTASKSEAKPAVEKAPKKPAAVKNAPVFPPIQGPASPVSADKQQRLAELLRKYKADELTPEEYHVQRAKIMGEP
jgi:hypothetical protein